jgi:acetylornithine deacetylase/succinyl-diaminopimelate desuccinylase-like protein
MGFDFLEEARAIIAIDSVSAHGTAAIAERLNRLLSTLDLEARLLEATLCGMRQVTLIAEKGPVTRDDLLLNTHLDTVPPGDPSAWTACGGDPFRAVIDGDRIYGLGSADTKLDILCKLKALESFRGIRFRRRAALVGTFGEEVGLLGARALVDSGYFNFAYALVGEPSSLRPVFAHKGRSVWEVRVAPADGNPSPKAEEEIIDLVFLGERAHASTPERGRNAILAALDFLTEARRKGQAPRLFGLSGGTASNVVPDRCDLRVAYSAPLAEIAQAAGARITRREIRSGRPIHAAQVLPDLLEGLRGLEAGLAQYKDDTFDPPISTMSIGKLDCTEGTVKLVFEVRPIPTPSPDGFDVSISRLEERLSTRHPDMTVEICNLRANPPMRDARQGAILGAALEVLAEMGLPAEPTSKSTCTEAAVYSQLGIDTIVFGPGVSEGNAHRPNEYNSISQCEKAVAFYTRMIERLCVRT